MTIYHRYFRVTTGPLIEAGRALMQRRREAFVVIKAFCAEIGATDAHTYQSGNIAGFDFNIPPDPRVWASPTKSGVYRPRANTKAGRELKARVDALPTAPNLTTSISEVGLCNNFPALIHGGMGYSSVAFGAPERGVMFVKVPWRDIDPQELAEYKQQRASDSPTRYSNSLDHLLWTPTADMIEVKEWEVLREVEEINAAIRGEVPA